MNKEIRFDLHSHSKKVDGKNTATDMVMAAFRRKMDYFAVTEHNRSLLGSHIIEEGHQMEVIPGFELSTADGHALVLGIKPEIANKLLGQWGLLDQGTRALARVKKINEVLRTFYEEGALIIAAHPLLLFFSPISLISFTPEKLTRLFEDNLIQGAESHNYDIEHLLTDNFHLRFIYKLWHTYTDAFLKRHKIPVYSNSDAHNIGQVGRRHNVIKETYEGSLIDALRNKTVNVYPGQID